MTGHVLRAREVTRSAFASSGEPGFVTLDNPFYIISGILPPSHICNGPGQHHTSMAMVRDIHSHLHDGPGYHIRTSTMVRGNIILAWQWSGTPIHIYRWSGISYLNIHNGPGQHHSSMAMVRDIHLHLWMARDITAQHSQWSGATSF